MRINKILVSALVMALSFYSCDYLDVPPINKMMRFLIQNRV